MEVRLIKMIDSSAFIALSLTFISTFCALIYADYRIVTTTFGLATFMLGVSFLINHRKEYVAGGRISWRRIERVHHLLSLMTDPTSSLVMIYHYGKKYSENSWLEVKNRGGGIVEKIQAEALGIMNDWGDKHNTIQLTRIDDNYSSDELRTDLCSHPQCFFIRGYVEELLGRAVRDGLLGRGRYLLRSCDESCVIIDL